MDPTDKSNVTWWNQDFVLNIEINKSNLIELR